MDVLCTDKTGTLTEASIKLVRAHRRARRREQRGLRHAYINSHFETGMKSPLDEAILAAHIRSIMAGGQDRRSAVRFRAAAGLRAGRARRQAPSDRQGRAGGPAAAVGAIRGGRGAELPLDPETRSAFQATLDELGAQGFRALGVAGQRRRPSHHTPRSAMRAIWSLPASPSSSIRRRPAPAAAIQALAAAGVSVKVLTGDNERVTRHVFEEIGVPSTGVLTGDDLTNLSDEALLGQLPTVNLFCRVNPQQKLRVSAGAEARSAMSSASWATASTTRRRCMRPTSASPSTAPPMSRAQAADLILLEHDLSVRARRA